MDSDTVTFSHPPPATSTARMPARQNKSSARRRAVFGWLNRRWNFDGENGQEQVDCYAARKKDDDGGWWWCFFFFFFVGIVGDMYEGKVVGTYIWQ